MKVYIITQAWEGDIRGVFLSQAEAERECEAINKRDSAPACVEEHDVIDGSLAGHSGDCAKVTTATVTGRTDAACTCAVDAWADGGYLEHGRY